MAALLTRHLLGHREGYPNIRTVDYWLGGNKAERHPQSRYAEYLNSLRIDTMLTAGN